MCLNLEENDSSQNFNLIFLQEEKMTKSNTVII